MRFPNFSLLVLAPVLLFTGCSKAAPTVETAPSIATKTTESETSSIKLKAFFQRLQAGEKQTVVVYGTSLTEFGAWTETMKSWFDKQYPNQVKFVNSGLAGKNSDEGVAQLKTKVLAQSPSLVFIEFSINDSRASFQMSKEKSASNLNKIVQAVQTQNPDAAIVLQVMNVTWDAPNGKQSSTIRPQYEAYNDIYRHYAREHNLTLIDHWDNWKKLRENDLELYTALIPDGTHPSIEGSNTVTWPLIKATLEAANAK